MTLETAAEIAVLRGMDTVPVALDSETIEIYSRPFWPGKTCPDSQQVRLDAVSAALGRLHTLGDVSRVDTRLQGTLYQLTPKGQIAARNA